MMEMGVVDLNITQPHKHIATIQQFLSHRTRNMDGVIIKQHELLLLEGPSRESIMSGQVGKMPDCFYHGLHTVTTFGWPQSDHTRRPLQFLL